MSYEGKAKERMRSAKESSDGWRHIGEDPPLEKNEQMVPKGAPTAEAVPTLSEQRTLQAIARFKQYMKQERERYYPIGRPLTNRMACTLGPFFRPELLARVRITELAGRRLENPPFYADARASGFVNLPDITHKACVTFLDVVVFNETVTDRNLFHALVHAVQVCVLGMDRYCDLFVRGFIRMHSYFLIPMKAHAFALDARYAEKPSAVFSVEEEVQTWLSEGRY